MKYTVIRTDIADAGIRKIVLYIAQNFGNTAALEKLNEIEKRIPENVFLRIHKSYLVNKNYVKEFTYEWVKMLNGDVLNISKINRADVRRKILESAADEFKNI